jgi:hypothetical protein
MSLAISFSSASSFLSEELRFYFLDPVEEVWSGKSEEYSNEECSAQEKNENSLEIVTNVGQRLGAYLTVPIC